MGSTIYERLCIYGIIGIVLFLAGMDTMRYIDNAQALKAYKQEVIQRDAMQVKLDAADLKLAEAQRAVHEQRTIEVVKYETKWRDAPAVNQQSCIDAGLFELTDATLGSLPRNADSTK